MSFAIGDLITKGLGLLASPSLEAGSAAPVQATVAQPNPLLAEAQRTEAASLHTPSGDHSFKSLDQRVTVLEQVIKTIFATLGLGKPQIQAVNLVAPQASPQPDLVVPGAVVEVKNPPINQQQQLAEILKALETPTPAATQAPKTVVMPAQNSASQQPSPVPATVV